LSDDDRPRDSSAPDPRVLAEQVRLLYVRAPIAQATVVVNACLVAWIFWDLVPRGRTLAWVTALCALVLVRMALVRAYRRSATAAEPSEAGAWGRRFVVASGLTGVCWGAAAFIFYTPQSPVHELFLAFVLGGMAAGAASSNGSHLPAFVAYAAPALLPLVLRLALEREPAHAAMAFMVVLFAVAVGGISRSGSRTLQEALRLRFANEALVEDLTAARQRLERLNADLERRVGERTGELERALALRVASETRLVEAHEALRESDQRKNQFIAVLSHELRNPLAAIRTSLYLLEHAARDDQRFVRAREVIDRQAGHLTRLVDDLLDATRISRAKIDLRRARIDARQVVRAACDDHRAEFLDRDLDLRVETSAPAWIDADETRIAQVVGNLLHNAAKFSRAGGTVVVSVAPAGDRAEIRVRDDGVGISTDLLPHVFDPFVQGYGGLARTKGGLGLGLALVKGLVELHGGSVHVRSEGVDRGAEFIVQLPLARAPAVRAVTPVPLAAARKASVLVIEDNLDSARSIADVLSLEGHHVHVATDARSGIAKARELKPDVILCDIGLPDMDGYEIARAIRAEAWLRSTRLVALSGYAQPEDRQRAAEAGFDQHIAKPAAMEDLLATVAQRSS
jgi:signal transduction histidine kinase